MNPRHLNVYDPAMCCSTGVCGPEIDPALVRFAADLEWIEKQGAGVRRYNLAQEPEAFARTDVVRQALEQDGEKALPLVVVDGLILSRGRYPNRSELRDWAGLSAVEGARVTLANAPEAATESCCGGGESSSGAGSGCC